MKPPCFQIAHAVGKGADSGENDLVRLQHHLRVGGHDRFAADPLKPFLHRTKISHAVIDYRYHCKNLWPQGYEETQDALKSRIFNSFVVPLSSLALLARVSYRFIAFGGNDPFNPRIHLRRHVQRAGHPLEASLQDVVHVIAVHDVDVEVGADIVDECLEKLTGQFHVEFAYFHFRKIDVVDHVRAAGEVDRHTGQGLVHGNRRLPVTADPFLVAERFTECLSKDNADIFHRVVKIDVDVPFASTCRSKKP